MKMKKPSKDLIVDHQGSQRKELDKIRVSAADSPNRSHPFIMSDNFDLSPERGLGFAALSAEASSVTPKFRPIVIADLNDNPPEEADDDLILQPPLVSRFLFLFF